MNNLKRWLHGGVVVVLAVGVSLRAMGETAPQAEPDPAGGKVPTVATATALTSAQRGALYEATTALNEGDYERAERILRAVLVDTPDLEPALQVLVAVLVQAGKEIESKEAFERFMPRLREDYRFLNNYAWFLVTAQNKAFRNPPRALELARDAVLLAPNVYQVWSTLAEVHYMNGNFERAVQAMRQTLVVATREQAQPEVLKKYQASLQKMMEAQAVMSLIE